MTSTMAGAALALLGLAAGKGRACPASLCGQRRHGASGGLDISFLTSIFSLPAVIRGAAFWQWCVAYGLAEFRVVLCCQPGGIL